MPNPILQISARLFATAALVAAACAPGIAGADDAHTPAPDRSRELLHLIRHDCGACHGMTLAGGLGPALLPQTLRDKSADGLRRTILDGRPGTAMPPWKAFVGDDEARWMVEMLMKGLPDGS